MKFLSSFTNDPEKRKVYGWLVVFSLFLLLLGYLLKRLGAPELSAHFANEIGIAGLVGFFLAITIEDLSQREFHEIAERERAEIKKDVFYYVYGYEIPLSIRDEIDQHILKVRYVRRKVEMRYDLQPKQDSKTKEWYVLATLTMSYDLQNLTTDEVTFPFSAAIDKSPSVQLADETKFISLSVTGCKTPFELDEKALKLKQIDEGNEYSLSLPNEIVLPPKRPTDPGQPSASTNLTRVIFKTKTVRFLNHGHIDFIFTSHICDLDLLVLADLGLKVYPSTSELNPLERQPEIPPTLSWVHEAVSANRELYYWKLQKPLLAYQSLQIFWAPDGAEFNSSNNKVDEEAEAKEVIAG